MGTLIDLPEEINNILEYQDLNFDSKLKISKYNNNIFNFFLRAFTGEIPYFPSYFVRDSSFINETTYFPLYNQRYYNYNDTLIIGFKPINLLILKDLHSIKIILEDQTVMTNIITEVLNDKQYLCMG